MKFSFILFVLLAMPCHAQTLTTGKAATKGMCSPAVSGNKNTFIFQCGIGRKQGSEIIAILNKMLANQIAPDAVMAKLDEILRAINPNLPVKTYFCAGDWRTIGPGNNADIQVDGGGDYVAFNEMVKLSNLRQVQPLLESCQGYLKTMPGWLSPHLFCATAYYRLGNIVKAKEELKVYETTKGPAYDDTHCSVIVEKLHHALDGK